MNTCPCSCICCAVYVLNKSRRRNNNHITIWQHHTIYIFQADKWPNEIWRVPVSSYPRPPSPTHPPATAPSLATHPSIPLDTKCHVGTRSLGPICKIIVCKIMSNRTVSLTPRLCFDIGQHFCYNFDTSCFIRGCLIEQASADRPISR